MVRTGTLVLLLTFFIVGLHVDTTLAANACEYGLTCERPASCDSPASVDDALFCQAMAQQIPVSISTMKGEEFEGLVCGFDDSVIIINDAKGAFIVYRHAMAKLDVDQFFCTN